MDCRVISYAWNWVSGKPTIDWEELDAGDELRSLHISVIGL